MACVGLDLDLAFALASGFVFEDNKGVAFPLSLSPLGWPSLSASWALALALAPWDLSLGWAPFLSLSLPLGVLGSAPPAASLALAAPTAAFSFWAACVLCWRFFCAARAFWRWCSRSLASSLAFLMALCSPTNAKRFVPSILGSSPLACHMASQSLLAWSRPLTTPSKGSLERDATSRPRSLPYPPAAWWSLGSCLSLPPFSRGDWSRHSFRDEGGLDGLPPGVPAAPAFLPRDGAKSGSNSRFGMKWFFQHHDRELSVLSFASFSLGRPCGSQSRRTTTIGPSAPSSLGFAAAKSSSTSSPFFPLAFFFFFLAFFCCCCCRAYFPSASMWASLTRTRSSTLTSGRPGTSYPAPSRFAVEVGASARTGATLVLIAASEDVGWLPFGRVSSFGAAGVDGADGAASMSMSTMATAPPSESGPRRALSLSPGSRFEASASVPKISGNFWGREKIVQKRLLLPVSVQQARDFGEPPDNQLGL